MYLQIVISINGNELNRYSFSESEIVIGRNPECNVVIDNPGISRIHAKIVRQGDQIEIFDLGSGNGTFVNGSAVTNSAVKKGDVIALGKFTVSVQLSDEAQPENPAQASASVSAASAASSTVYLRPDETKKIVQQAHVAQAHASASVRPSKQVQDNKSMNTAWIFGAGLIVGVVLGWIFWA